MKTTRYSASRQKACLCCSAAKAKCDRKIDCCTRCALRGMSCTYPQALFPRGSANTANDSSGAELSNLLSTPSDFCASEHLPNPEHNHPTAAGTWSLVAGPTQSIDNDRLVNNSSTTITEGQISKDLELNGSSNLFEVFRNPDLPAPEPSTGLELVCPINVDDIRNRWLNSYISVPGGKIKQYPASITSFTYRILKSYAAVTVRGRGVPPFVHTSQIMTGSARLPISTCLTLVRMFEKPLPGGESVAAGVLEREMGNIYEKHEAYDDLTLLAAFQAYLIYSMVLYFKLGEQSRQFLRKAITNLQDLACSSSRGGLMCIAEQQRARPKWETWVVAESKRRTLFTMYLFDSVLSAQDSLPTLLGTELQGLLAPANQDLWTTRSRREWESAYNIHLVDWAEGLRIDELWPLPAGLDEAKLLERRDRVDRWLENIDEYGTMLYAVTSCTHGG